jgi:UDP:flavonoid glycosyltransferase YjiC (YdhE family)
MDQLLSMEAVERVGAGIALRGAKISSADLFLTASVMLGNSPYAQAATRLSGLLQRYDAGQRLGEIVTEIFAKKGEQLSSG